MLKFEFHKISSWFSRFNWRFRIIV